MLAPRSACSKATRPAAAGARTASRRVARMRGERAQRSMRGKRARPATASVGVVTRMASSRPQGRHKRTHSGPVLLRTLDDLVKVSQTLGASSRQQRARRTIMSNWQMPRDPAWWQPDGSFTCPMGKLTKREVDQERAKGGIKAISGPQLTCVCHGMRRQCSNSAPSMWMTMAWCPTRTSPQR